MSPRQDPRSRAGYATGAAARPLRDGFVVHFLRAYPGRTALVVVLLFLAGLAEGVGILTLLPVLELTLDTGTGGDSPWAAAVYRALDAVGLEPRLGTLLALMVGAITVRGALRWLTMRQVGYTAARVGTELRLRLIHALTRARWGFVAEQPAGRALTGVSWEARQVAAAYRQTCSMLADLVQSGVSVVVIVLLSWQVGLLSLAVGAFVVLLLHGFVRMSRQAGHRQTEAMQNLVVRLTELLPNLKPVRAMAREPTFTALLEEQAEAYDRAERQAVLAYETVASFREPILAVVLALGLYAALTYGVLAFPLILALAILFYRAMVVLGNVQSKYQSLVAGESAFWSLRGQIEGAEAAREPRLGRRPPPRLERSLELRDVCFGYDDDPILEHASLRIPAGAFVSVTGPSGAGKTTLVDLIVGLLQPDSGEVLVDGIPLQDVDLSAWRGMIGYVPQELLLLHDTIYRNVTMGDETVGPEEVREALEAAGAWEFVQRFPEGTGRMIGERGARLSGGQGQRIMLARALVHRPRLLILDEATVGLDPEVEAAIRDSLRRLRDRMTLISISHQQVMRAAADLVIEVSGGEIRIEPSGELASVAPVPPGDPGDGVAARDPLAAPAVADPAEPDARQPRLAASIIVPTHNRYQMVTRTVSTLARQIEEDGLEGSVEVVVVDDGSDPEVAARLQRHVSAMHRPFLRWLALPENRGGSAARNAGARAARGEVLAFLDDDIVPADGYVSAILRAHREHPEALVINGNLRPLRDDAYSGFWFYHYDAVFNEPGEDFYTVPMLASGHASLKREVLELEDPLFDTDLTAREDYDLYLRLASRGIPVYKDDRILGFNDCRRTLWGFVRQRLWYDRGQDQLVVKHGAEFLERQALKSRVPPSPSYGHLYLLLRVARGVRRLYAGVRRLVARSGRPPGHDPGGASNGPRGRSGSRAAPSADAGDLPTLSIIVLTYNRRRLLRDCLDSLLAQRYPREKLEIIVSDDGSDDGTGPMVERLARWHRHLRHCPQPHAGIPAARNNGIREATGDIVAIVADDYVLEPGYAAAIAEFFAARPEASVVRHKVVAAGRDPGSRISHFYFDVSYRRRLAPGSEVEPRGWKERIAQVWRKVEPFEERVTTRHQLEASGAAAFRREVFQRVGLFEESLQRAEDTDMTRRLREAGIAVYHNPHHRIPHQYSPLMLDTVRKCFLTGFYRYRMHRQNELEGEGAGVVKILLLGQAGMVLDALWRARQAASTPKVLFFLPFMLLFEASNKLGFVLAFLSEHLGGPLRRGRRSDPEEPARPGGGPARDGADSESPPEVLECAGRRAERSVGR